MNSKANYRTSSFATRFTPLQPRPLESIIDIERAQNKSTEELTDIWDDENLQGSKSYSAHPHEMRDPLTKELLGQIKFFYEMNCSNERGWTTKEAESHYNQMVNLLQEENSQRDSNEHLCL
ncbi:uncharacterized protein LOC111367305 isoform X1 [Olea europaea var. sylvestris]|uniref:uncharacterized protein LOC111367305 isoform X1 n=1 Tax=Olea europaea var. sylvestris TaxID=158386 RepID=UPI000C1D6693|nr:uncharacterized protein LOC111367305 isoform X1 [Olea europaea var. sylvestris]